MGLKPYCSRSDSLWSIANCTASIINDGAPVEVESVGGGAEAEKEVEDEQEVLVPGSGTPGTTFLLPFRVLV